MGTLTMSAQGVQILGPVEGDHKRILTSEALQFLAVLHRTFNGKRLDLLRRRQLRQQEFDAGALPNFDPETKAIRDDDSWTGPAPMPGLEDRRVEITGPVDRKMVINALNSGSATYMADFEDSNAPTWLNNLDGQVNLGDAVRGTISLDQGQKKYRLSEKPATLIVRTRGWHLDETHVLVDGQVMSGSLFDFGLFFFHNAKDQVARGKGPYFYLPKMEHYLEARLWNDIFRMSQDYIGIPRGSIRATVLIKTDEAKNSAVMDKVRADKQRECDAGHDGTWVAHPGLVKIAMDIFNKGMPGPNQYHVRRENVHVT